MRFKIVFVTFGLALAACGNPAAESCGNGLCVAGSGETCSTCPADCAVCAACGDGSCRGGETCASCPGDCGACAGCGDGSCSTTETCSTCVADCGACSGCGPATCTGCCDGGSCVTGASPGACGSGGAACMVCAPSFLCTAGTCFVDPASRWNIVPEALSVSATRYDGAGWDTIGGNPDLVLGVVVGSASATPVTSGVAPDTYSTTFDGTPTVSGARADQLLAFLGFAAVDDDSPAGSEIIGYCGYDATAGGPLPAAVFTETTQAVNCGIDAATMNSGFMLTWHLERF